MPKQTQTLNLRLLIRELADDRNAVVYVTDSEHLWQIAGVERGCFVLSDCSQPLGKYETVRRVPAVELALTYRRVAPAVTGADVTAVGEHSNCG